MKVIYNIQAYTHLEAAQQVDSSIVDRTIPFRMRVINTERLPDYRLDIRIEVEYLDNNRPQDTAGE